jgi:hypothetical protein
MGHYEKMRHLIQILTFIPILTFGQTFNLTETVFQKEDIYRTYEIKFDLTKPWICAESNLYIDSIAIFMLRHQNLIFEIGVHSEAKQWTDKYSYCMTCKRAESIKDYLVLKGVTPDQIKSKGYNDSQPIIVDSIVFNTNSEEEQEKLHQINRRTEFKILEIKENSVPIFDYLIVEKKPIFPGGETELLRYISKNMKYPSIQNDCIFTKVFLNFTIESTGKCIDPDVSINNCTISEVFKKEMNKMILGMPLWTPGEFDGKTVNVRFRVPVNIDLK